MLIFHLTIVVDIILEDVFFASSWHIKLHLFVSFGAYQTLAKRNLKLGVMMWMLGSSLNPKPYLIVVLYKSSNKELI
jgi:hypothetical protein